MKKSLLMILVLLMLLPMVAACANQTGDGEDTTPEQQSTSATNVAEDTNTTDTTLEKLTPDLPDVKYQGYSFVVANDFADSTKYTTNAIRSDIQQGESINDALYDRTVLIESMFGVEIVDADVDIGPIKTAIQSGDDLYAIATIDLSNIMSMVNAGYSLDMRNIETIDLSMPWWDQNAQQKLSINGKLYYTFSDFLITALDNARATYFNKDLIRDLNLEDPYTLVNQNKWTIEKMQTMAKTALDDRDGNGIYNINDRVGIANNATTFYEAMLTGCNAEIIKQGSDGVPYFCCFDEKEFFVNVYQKLLSTFSEGDFYLITNTDDGRSMFINNNTLFTVDTLYMASKSRASDVNFGILPVAKWDEAQENYIQVSPNPHSIMIPSPTQNVERTGVLLEALSYYSSAYYSDTALIPAYYETALKYKSSTDVESAEMLTIIHDNISYVNKIVGTTFSSQIYSFFAAGKMDINSLLKGQETNQRKLLSKTLEQINGLEH